MAKKWNGSIWDNYAARPHDWEQASQRAHREHQSSEATRVANEAERMRELAEEELTERRRQTELEMDRQRLEEQRRLEEQQQREWQAEDAAWRARAPSRLYDLSKQAERTAAMARRKLIGKVLPPDRGAWRETLFFIREALSFDRKSLRDLAHFEKLDQIQEEAKRLRFWVEKWVDYFVAEEAEEALAKRHAPLRSLTSQSRDRFLADMEEAQLPITWNRWGRLQDRLAGLGKLLFRCAAVCGMVAAGALAVNLWDAVNRDVYAMEERMAAAGVKPHEGWEPRQPSSGIFTAQALAACVGCLVLAVVVRSLLGGWAGRISYREVQAAWQRKEELAERWRSLGVTASPISRRKQFDGQVGQIKHLLSEVEWDGAAWKPTAAAVSREEGSRRGSCAWSLRPRGV
jgi:hypothetical protein